MLNFFRVICLCHDVTKVTDRNDKSFLTGPHQDEICLLEMAKKTNYVNFIERDSSFFHIEVLGKREVYKNIKFYDFTSERKMMTRIVQRVNPDNGLVADDEFNEVLVLSKGADTSILSRGIPRKDAEGVRAGGGQDPDRSMQERFDDLSNEEKAVVEHIEKSAEEGLRTLAFGYKRLPSADIDTLE